LPPLHPTPTRGRARPRRQRSAESRRPRTRPFFPLHRDARRFVAQGLARLDRPLEDCAEARFGPVGSHQLLERRGRAPLRLDRSGGAGEGQHVAPPLPLARARGPRGVRRIAREVEGVAQRGHANDEVGEGNRGRRLGSRHGRRNPLADLRGLLDDEAGRNRARAFDRLRDRSAAQGFVHVESESGKGATFRVFLPLAGVGSAGSAREE
jgi:hypothetical protein